MQNKLNGDKERMRQSPFRFLLFMAIVMNVFFAPVNAADKLMTPSFENDQLRLQVFPRTTEQMAGFFEARGFPVAMIQQLSMYCFFTIIIENKMNKQLWLDLSGWEFSVGLRQLSRMPRSMWPPIWETLGVPRASQSTFRWTLLPETLHFYANESEGGNIVLQKTNETFVLRAKFGVDDEKDSLLAPINDLRCADAEDGRQ